MENVIMESQQLIQRNLSKLNYDPKTQTIDSHIKDAKTGKNFRIKLIIDDNHPKFKEIWEKRRSKSPALAHYATEYLKEGNKDCDKFIENSYVLTKSRLMNMRNNATVAVLNHEIGHIIDKIHTNFPDRLTPADVKKIDKLKAITTDVFENTDKYSLNKHDRNVAEPFADAFAADNTSTHSTYQALKNSKVKRNDEYAKLKKLRREYEKIRKEIPEEEEKKIRAEVVTLIDKMMGLLNKPDSDEEIDKLHHQQDALYEKLNKINMKKMDINENRQDVHSPQRRINRNEMTKKIHDRMNQVNEMYIDNIITESEYIQLQERIQILTERSE